MSRGRPQNGSRQDRKRPCAIPNRRWRDEPDAHSKDWTSVAQKELCVWKEESEAFAQQWDTIGFKKIRYYNNFVIIF